MKVLVTGATGLLGRYVVKHFSDAGEEVIAAVHRDVLPSSFRVQHIYLDISEPIWLHEVKPDVVIHCAGVTDVDWCQTHMHQTMSINVGGTANALVAAKLVDAKFIYISSNDVFDDCPNNTGWLPKDSTLPRNVYGRSKKEAEDYVLRYQNSVAVRTSFHGWCTRPNHSISHKVVNSLRAQQEIKMATDQYSCLMYAGDLARVLHGLCYEDRDPIVHACSGNHSSRFVFAHMVAETFGLNDKLIVPVPYQQIWEENNLVAHRPMKAILHPTIPSVTLEDGIEHMKMDEETWLSLLQ